MSFIMASLQQVVEQLVLLAAHGTNSTTGLNATAATSAPHGPLEFATSTASTLFSASALRDWAILLLIGSFFETVRRLLSSLWHASINACFVTAVFDECDASFQWIMLWLSEQPSWKQARSVEISTSNFDLDPAQRSPKGVPDPSSQNVAYLPMVSESYNLWYKYRWVKITREVISSRGGWSTRETLTMSIMTRDHAVLTEILQDAQRIYTKAQQNKITIYVSDSRTDGWRELAKRPKRPLHSIILDPGITELVLEDVRDFLGNKWWYAERGIPFRRGYLLYGAPGSGKTSLIQSIAGELGLNVYIISLSRSGLDDTGLSALISALPERCIALMEDIDAAFHHGLSRETQNVPSTQSSDDPNELPINAPPVPSGNRVSLSGLLNALDGIGAQEGRVLFATTNKYNALDPALCRPGRMDLHVEFKHASKFQAEELFKRFYAPAPSAKATKRENGYVGADVDEGEDPLIDLSESQSQAPLAPSPSPPLSSPPSSASSLTMVEKSEENDAQQEPTYVGVVHGRGPKLSRNRINALAAQFALAIPERQLSMANLQGFLMMHKTTPISSVAEIGAWVEKELAEGKDKGEKGA